MRMNWVGEVQITIECIDTKNIVVLDVFPKDTVQGCDLNHFNDETASQLMTDLFAKTLHMLWRGKGFLEHRKMMQEITKPTSVQWE